MSSLWERAVVGWPLLIAETLLFGTTAFSLLIERSARCADEAVAAAFESLWRVMALVAFVCASASVVIVTADMAGVSMRAAVPLLPDALRQTYVGRAWSISFPATTALVIMVWLPRRRAMHVTGLWTLAAVLLLCGSVVSHAADRGALAVAVHFIHQGAAAVWLGSLFGLWWGVRQSGVGPEWMQAAAPRVSRIAGWAAALLLLTGICSTYYTLGLDPGNLIDTAYGRIVLSKAGMGSLVFLIGACNRHYLLPTMTQETSRRALLRNVAVESALLMIVLGLAAVLANIAPAYHH